MTVMPAFLVILPDEIKEVSHALRYAALRARQANGRVALLSIVEPEEIGAWGGVDKVLTDDAFDRARKVMAHYVSCVQELSEQEPLTFFCKGERRAALLDLIKQEADIAALVLTAHAGEGGRNTLIQYLTSDKGLKKLPIPLIVVPANCCRDDLVLDKEKELCCDAALKKAQNEQKDQDHVSQEDQQEKEDDPTQT